MKQWSEQYSNLLDNIKSNGFRELNERTGEYVLSMAGAQFFSIDMSNCILPIPNNRKYFPRSSAAEVAWLLQGTKHLKWFSKYSSIWSKFTNSEGEIESAYGHRIKNQFNRDQLSLAISALKNDKSNRQIVINLWDPSIDGLGESNMSNVPCPTQFVLNVVNNKLHLSVVMRSSDVFVGLPYDVMTFAFLLNAIACELFIENGILSFTLSHAHIYEQHLNLIKENENNTFPILHIPPFTCGLIEKSPDRFINEISHRLKYIEQVDYNPKPEVFL